MPRNTTFVTAGNVERFTGPDDPKGFIKFANIGVEPRNVLFRHSGWHETVPCSQEPRLPQPNRTCISNNLRVGVAIEIPPESLLESASFPFLWRPLALWVLKQVISFFACLPSWCFCNSGKVHYESGVAVDQAKKAVASYTLFVYVL